MLANLVRKTCHSINFKDFKLIMKKNLGLLDYKETFTIQ